MSQDPPLETFNPFSLLGRSDMCFLLEIQPSSCLKSLSSGHLWEDLHLHLCQVLQPFIVSSMLSGTSWSKKPKPLIPQRGTRADQIICSVISAIVPSTQLFTPLNKGSKGYFLSCYHFQYPQTIICYLYVDLLFILNE